MTQCKYPAWFPLLPAQVHFPKLGRLIAAVFNCEFSPLWSSFHILTQRALGRVRVPGGGANLLNTINNWLIGDVAIAVRGGGG